MEPLQDLLAAAVASNDERIPPRSAATNVDRGIRDNVTLAVEYAGHRASLAGASDQRDLV